MNTIEVRFEKVPYADDGHLVVCIDGRPLHELVEQLAPDRELDGLVPTRLDWIEDPRERALVRARAVLSRSRTAVLPVLMCPDDRDLWCSVVVAEIEPVGERVVWRRLGIDCTSRESLMRGEVGEDVDWIEGAGPFEFDRTSYEECVASIW